MHPPNVIAIVGRRLQLLQARGQVGELHAYSIGQAVISAASTFAAGYSAAERVTSRAIFPLA